MAVENGNDDTPGVRENGAGDTAGSCENGAGDKPGSGGWNGAEYTPGVDTENGIGDAPNGGKSGDCAAPGGGVENDAGRPPESPDLLSFLNAALAFRSLYCVPLIARAGPCLLPAVYASQAA